MCLVFSKWDERGTALGETAEGFGGEVHETQLQADVFVRGQDDPALIFAVEEGRR